jgi:hypothetical protein
MLLIGDRSIAYQIQVKFAEKLFDFPEDSALEKTDNKRFIHV